MYVRATTSCTNSRFFPKGRYDDQVDSTSQALEFIKDIKPETGSQAFYRQAAERRRLGLT